MSKQRNTESIANSPWPRRVARLLVCATFPLIFVGGLVTTYQAGMAVPDWPSTYGYNLFLYPWATWWAGPWDLFVEHGHRLLGAAVGLLTLVVAGLIWKYEPRRSLRLLSLAALMLVIGQGLLGGARVLLDDYLLAQIHGCTAPVFFAVATAIAVLLSPRWHEAEHCPDPQEQPSRWSIQPAIASAMIVLLIYSQIVLGSQLRHTAPWTAPQAVVGFLWFHLIIAAAAVIGIAAMSFTVERLPGATSYERRPPRLLLLLFVAQICMGTATWIVQYGYPDFMKSLPGTAGFLVQAESFTQSLVTTVHVATGSLILAVSVVASLRIGRATWVRQELVEQGSSAAQRSGSARLRQRGEVPA